MVWVTAIYSGRGREEVDSSYENTLDVKGK